MRARTSSILRCALGFTLLLTISACSAGRGAIEKGVTYVEKKDQRMVILSPEYLQSILGVSGKTSILIYVGVGNLQYRFKGSTRSTMIEERYVPASLTLPLVISCPRKYQGYEAFAREFVIYCLESGKAKVLEVDFEKKEVKALDTTSIRPDRIIHVRDGTVFFRP